MASCVDDCLIRLGGEVVHGSLTRVQEGHVHVRHVVLMASCVDDCLTCGQVVIEGLEVDGTLVLLTVARHVAGIATAGFPQLGQVGGELVILARLATRLLGIGEDPVVLLTEILHGQLQLLHVCDSIVDTGFVCAGALSLNVYPFAVVVLPVLLGFLLFLLLFLSGLLLLLFVCLLGCFPGLLLVLLVLVLASTIGLVLPTLLLL